MKTPNIINLRRQPVVALQIALLFLIAPLCFAGPSQSINFVGSSTASTYAVTATPGIALAANVNRKDAVLVNSGAGDCFLYRSAVAGTPPAGIKLYANGGAYNIDQNNLYKGDISAVTASGTTTLSISEGK